ncbi:MAG: SPASM domain-containing protein [Planctomycetes bacterium]|nr:SPASM domain-containing protein [Planctomycetota bacterium]MCB9868844.1 SPASM domain-containing protein [Planctomycetota bacterium]MCB9889558.1 SPASM domain-containing protein [Planctomycetota bacterium]
MPVIREKRFLRVKLDMVTRCQLRCIMCHFAHPDFQESKVTMGGELLEKVGSELFPIAHDVVLSSSAEPLLAKDLPRALELCREHGVPNFHFSTNLLAMNRRIMEKVIEVQMPLMTVSIDGATKETFERIRPPAKWESLMDRFDLVREVKQASGSDLPHLSATAVLMRSNIREMPDLIRLMRDKGVTQMNFVHMAVMGGLGIENETLVNDPRLCNATLREMRRVADEVGMQVMLPMEIPEKLAAGRPDGDLLDATRSDDGGGSALRQSDEMVGVEGSLDVAAYLNHKIDEFLLKAKKKDDHRRACYFPWYYIHVNPDGTVFPCGSWFEFTTFGDFKTQSFREIWTGEKFTELRRQIREMELRDVCANCSVANMGRPDVLASFSHRAKVRRGNRPATSG